MEELADRIGQMPGLVEFLAAVPDHRRAQGRRHTLVSILALACAATAAGAKSLVAIAEWAADEPAAVLAALGVRRDPCGGALVVPSETTIRRALSDTDPGALDEQLAAWAAASAVRVGHVKLDGARRESLARELMGRSFTGSRVTAADQHVDAEAGDMGGGLSAQAPIGAGDQPTLPGQVLTIGTILPRSTQGQAPLGVEDTPLH